MTAEENPCEMLSHIDTDGGFHAIVLKATLAAPNTFFEDTE